MRSALPLAVAAVAVLGAAGCGGGTTDAAADGKVAVVASTNVWGSVVQAVGGDDVSVRSLINDSKGDPHSYADKPEDATLLTEAKLVVYNGGGYDDFFTKLVDAAGADAKQVVAYDVAGLAEGENEHVWYDFATVKKVAGKVAEELGAIDPDNKDTYADNAKAFDGKIDELTTKAGAIPDGDVVATEPVAKYLLDAAGLTDVTPPDFSEAIEEETDPPVATVADTMDLVTGKQIVALVNNDQTETNVTDQLNGAAKSAGVPIVNVSETLPPGVTDYVEWMTKQVDALAGAVA
ncbi:metal ABC transporter solute-binding protein, Zn/Mn family [Actinophytocola algeriensis]|uniref:Zinc/manganese transport system substrate-binding protein n=1 Tax=Actinophytocola algeriensis TaxID=1768010 RepID=A0A7W7Q5K4_9PSEU|nr:zinc ABC transporter substrate-binding protein [Actinophytocola algeriensis]MBB4907248.1 zinc/manganese transport system substrate-binding protein [Actinophytocola algeriensis]MBE1478731.1 zinc/manganese transport system substrate-binding protein [Actinophytocola algeriensis]